MEKSLTTFLVLFKLLGNPDLNAQTIEARQVAVSTCVHLQIKETCRLWSLCVIKTPERPKFLHRRFIGIRWWNKGLIFIWQGSQSLADWSNPCGRPHSHNWLSLLHALGLCKTTFRMHCVPRVTSHFIGIVKIWDLSVIFFRTQVSKWQTYSTNYVLYWVTAIGSKPYLHVSTLWWLFPFVIFLLLLLSILSLIEKSNQFPYAVLMTDGKRYFMEMWSRDW